ncbi:hypothetical protein [Bacteroides sp.]
MVIEEKSFTIIIKDESVDVERLAKGVQLLLTPRVPIESQRNAIQNAIARQVREDKQKGKESCVAKIAQILSIFFAFPKIKGKGMLKPTSAEVDLYKAIRERADEPDEEP